MSVPITHREAIAAIPAAELARLKEPRDGPGLLRLLAHVGALAVTGAVIVSAPSPWLWLPALLVHGILLVFLFTLEHECIHETAFRTGWLNSALAEITGLACSCRHAGSAISTWRITATPRTPSTIRSWPRHQRRLFAPISGG